MTNIMDYVIWTNNKIVLNAHQIQNGIESKQGRANFVTKYDVEVQNFLYQELKKLYPDAAFIGEEDKQREKVTAEYCFIIDPIDGTTNFIFDNRHSSISVGVLHQGEIIMGVVYNPYMDELFYGEKGKGAFLNGRKLEVADLGISEGLYAFGTCPYYREEADETFDIAKKLFDKAMDFRRSGSAAIDICYVAANRFVLFYELVLSPWDYAAASIILLEAGGCITTLDRKKLQFEEKSSILAATPKAYEEYFTI